MALPAANPYILDITPYKGGESSDVPGTAKLSSNENPYGPSANALKAYADAGTSLHIYPDGGAHALRRAIAEESGLDAERIVCGAGSDEIIALLCSAYLAPGDNIVQSKHGFLMYAISAKRCGAHTIYAEEQDLRADIHAMAAAVNDSTKLVFLANPNNPTGSMVSKQEIITLREALPDHIILAVDAAYAEYVDDPEYSACEELTDIYPNLIVMRTFSKIYGLAALRVGRSYSCKAITDVLNRTRGPFNVAAPGLAAATASVRDIAYTRDMSARNIVTRTRLEACLDTLGITRYPSAANFVLTDMHTPETAAALDAHLRNNRVIVRSVASYGLPHCLRMSVGTDAENTQLMDALKQFSA